MDLTFVNTGTADAILSQVGLKFRTLPPGATLPNEPGIRAIHTFTGGMKLVCGVNGEFKDIDTGQAPSSQEFDELQQQRTKLYCIGWISYLDGGNRLRITGFCRVMEGSLTDAFHARFYKVDDPDYEYQD